MYEVVIFNRVTKHVYLIVRNVDVIEIDNTTFDLHINGACLSFELDFYDFTVRLESEDK